MNERERLAVHRPGEQDLRATRLLERDRASEPLGGLRLGAQIGAVEADVRGLAQRVGEREHVGKRDAGPSRGTGRARTPRRLARDVTDSDQARAPIARALQRRSHLALPERLAQGGKGKVQLPFDDPMHVQPPRGGVDLRHRSVPPHVKRVRGGQRTLRQRSEPSLGVERLLLVHDQIPALSIATHATSVRSPDPGARVPSASTSAIECTAAAGLAPKVGDRLV